MDRNHFDAPENVYFSKIRQKLEDIGETVMSMGLFSKAFFFGLEFITFFYVIVFHVIKLRNSEKNVAFEFYVILDKLYQFNKGENLRIKLTVLKKLQQLLE